MRPTFDMDALRTMVAGVELGSFARAANRLGRSQSAVSMQLKKLELQAGQQLFRKAGRGLATTEAGDRLLAYARRILALNDEAAASVNATAVGATVRLGLPQDFAEDILPMVLERFSSKWPGVHIEARAGRNYSLETDVSDGGLDIAILFALAGSGKDDTLIARLNMVWLAPWKAPSDEADNAMPLVMFDHPCLFRQAAIEALEAAGQPWRAALTTPSLQGVWAALRTGLGVTVRTTYGCPDDLDVVHHAPLFPPLPKIDLHLIAGHDLSPAALDLHTIVREVFRERLCAHHVASNGQALIASPEMKDMLGELS
ncbi:LysR substrate-binding domain-containing protein [Rhodovulum sp. FJ3]|uniref:LysR substrate-binding domain-containing protein n=1 Tax=Rhodovulum sp. FJ3 TaxID=3079053 RepID=UPI00293DCFCD|nr:LysR substrate-binding domain-containing protein [Rhodovulum sp. FJ3]MDV4169579.1 LysR substrate-binding domain-containing protein [Rhodovulum sp. FJ3]